VGAFQILLVEDNPGDVFLLNRALKQTGLECEVVRLPDGAAAVEYVRRRAPYEQSPLPDLAMLDMNLPKKDGAEVLEVMRQTPEYANVPVVMISSAASARDRERTTGMGDTRYLTKPMDLEGFLKIGELLKEILMAGRAGVVESA
jgi:CheY-like chemotaxis protein